MIYLSMIPYDNSNFKFVTDWLEKLVDGTFLISFLPAPIAGYVLAALTISIIFVILGRNSD